MAEAEVKQGGQDQEIPVETGTPVAKAEEAGAGAPVVEASSWLEGLPEDIRENPHLTRYKSREEAARGIIEAQTFISSTRPTIPKEDAPPEEWDKFYNSQGRPEKPEGYELAKPENLPEGFVYSEELDKQWQTWAHKAGLSAKAFKEIRDSYLAANVAYFNKVLEDQGQREERVTAALEETWGGKYKENLNLARITAKKYIADEGDWEALAFALNNDERLVGIFHRIGQDLSEDTLRGGGQHQPGEPFKKQAQAKQAELLNIDKRKEPQRYKEAQAEAETLFKKAEDAGELTQP